MVFFEGEFPCAHDASQDVLRLNSFEMIDHGEDEVTEEEEDMSIGNGELSREFYIETEALGNLTEDQNERNVEVKGM